VIQQENKRKAFFMFVFSSWPNVHYPLGILNNFLVFKRIKENWLECKNVPTWSPLW
jgi:hypothetical protein